MEKVLVVMLCYRPIQRLSDDRSINLNLSEPVRFSRGKIALAFCNNRKNRAHWIQIIQICGAKNDRHLVTFLKNSCSSKQREPLMGLELTTDSYLSVFFCLDNSLLITIILDKPLYFQMIPNLQYVSLTAPTYVFICQVCIAKNFCWFLECRK